MILCGGPLIDLGPNGMPEWLSQWQDDFINLQSFVCDFIETAVSRYTGRVRIWEVSARANTGVALGWARRTGWRWRSAAWKRRSAPILNPSFSSALISRGANTRRGANTDCRRFNSSIR